MYYNGGSEFKWLSNVRLPWSFKRGNFLSGDLYFHLLTYSWWLDLITKIESEHMDLYLDTVKDSGNLSKMFLIPRTSSFLSFSSGDDHFELASQSSRALCIVHTKSLRKMYFFLYQFNVNLYYRVSCFPKPVTIELELTTLYPSRSRAFSIWEGHLDKVQWKISCLRSKNRFFPKASGDSVFLRWSTGTKPSFQILFQGRFISPDLPGRERELNEFVAGVQGLRLVGHLLCQEPHLVVVQPVHRDPPASEVVVGWKS